MYVFIYIFLIQEYKMTVIGFGKQEKAQQILIIELKTYNKLSHIIIFNLKK